MLQSLLQPRLLLGRQPAKLGIVFERAALLCGRQVFIAAEPVAGVAGLVLRVAIRRMGFVRASFLNTGWRRSLFLKMVPLSVGRLRLRMMLLLRGMLVLSEGLGET